MANSYTLDIIEAPGSKQPTFSEVLPWYLKPFPPLLRTTSTVIPTYTARFLFFMATIPRFRAAHKVKDALLENFSDSGFFQGPKARMAWKKWGDSGDLVLLLHGWESRGTALRTFIEPLLQTGHQVMALDLPAHGDSSGFNTNLLESGEHLYHFIQEFQPRKIIAHSFGSAVTTYACSKGPTAFLEKVVLVAVPVSTIQIFQNVLDSLSLPDKLLKHFDKHVYNRYGMQLDSIDLRVLFQKTDIPSALVVHDMDDPVVPFEASQELAAAYEHILLQPTKGLGHFRLLRHDAVIDAVVRYLS